MGSFDEDFAGYTRKAKPVSEESPEISAFDQDFSDYVRGKPAKSSKSEKSTQDLLSNFDPLSLPPEGKRQAGLAARYLAEGIPQTAIPLMVGNAANAAVNYGIEGANKLLGSKIGPLQPPSAIFSNALTDIGLPNPGNALERVIGDVGRGLSGAGGNVILGKMLSNAGQPIANAVGESLSASPVLQSVAASSGNAAGGIARENGATPQEQFAINLLTSMIAPTAANTTPKLIRSVFRGADNSARHTLMQSNIDAFKEAGTTPTVGQSTQGLAQGLESILSKVPGSHSIINNKANMQSQEMGDTFNKLAQALSPNATSTKTGRMITNAIRGEGGFVDKFQNKADNLYKEFGELLGGETPVDVQNTQKALINNTSPILGAENTSNLFINPKMKAIAEAVNKDVQSEQPLTLENAYLNAFPESNVFNPSGRQSIEIPGTQAEGKNLPYRAVSGLRSLVGKKLAENPLVSDVPHSEYKNLYGGLSQDMQNAAEQAGPDALKAFNKANRYYKAAMGRISDLNPIINSSTPEKVFQSAMSGAKEGATNINTVMRSVDKPTKQAITATILKRMGLATPGNQNDLGDSFNTATFLTNWNKFSPEAKQTLFGSHGKEFQDKIDKLAKVADNLKSGSKIYANPSGTAQASAAINTLINAIYKPISVISSVVGANKLAKNLTNPEFVDWLAQDSQKLTGKQLAPILSNSLLQRPNQQQKQ